MSKTLATIDLSLRDNPHALKAWIKVQAMDLGFSDCVIAQPDTQNQMAYLHHYLEQGHHADMHYLAENLDKRANPALLVPDTQAIICVRLDYLHEKPQPRYIPDTPDIGIIARYARGRDYHKVMRGRLKQLAQRIEAKIGAFSSRPFSDSAPIFEKALAENAGMGWTGKHTLLINQQAGSFFVLGELFCSLALPFDMPTTQHCGSCTACIDICPTQAIVAPYQLDARKCIAYLTIEYKGSIPLALRPHIGNRIFGCDDCQLICPWNRYAKVTTLADFQPRHQLDRTSLLQFWQWDEQTFLNTTEGSPIRRTGFQSFKRNVAIALGNAAYSPHILTALAEPHPEHDDIVQEHVIWAISTQQQKQM
ncbi:MAG: tRNA epoxyqueuosine(34) reductase QueG [Acinetobacter sp.]|jgi:epoxyqueuosine reductase|nr:MAG: tRNA epoxyqueuosine(34) reductase QueG [Acinetobacter sp.]